MTKDIANSIKKLAVFGGVFAFPAILLSTLYCSFAHTNRIFQAQVAPPLNYAKQGNVKKLPDEFKADFGLHSINQEGANLQGSLCWFGYQYHATNPNLPSHLPVIQRITTGPTQNRVENWQLTAHGSEVVFVGAPKFKGSKNQAYFRVMRSGGDYSVYDIYSVDITNSTFKMNQSDIVPLDDFRVSPDGSSLAYLNSPPYESNPYNLVVSGNKSDIVVVDQPSEGFSWTSDNHLLYAAFSGKPDVTQNFGYPDIYSDDLKGSRTVVKQGGYRPLFSSEKQWLCYIGPDVTLTEEQKSSKDFRFHPRFVSNMAVFAFDTQQQKEFFVKRIYERYPEVVWVNQNLYVIENYYVSSKKTAYCRISKFDTRTQATTELCKLEQKGESSANEDGKLVPFFKLISPANGKSLLLQVLTKQGGPDNYQLSEVSLADGKRTDLFSFSAPSDDTTIGYVDWIDQ